MRRLLLAAILFRSVLAAGTGAALDRELRQTSLDPNECYRVRDLTLIKEDLKIYLTDGHLIFAQPVAGRRIAALYLPDVEGGDGEVILLPPNRAERASLASYSGSPTLDDHFQAALFLFTGKEYEALIAQFPRNPANKRDPAAGAHIDPSWNETLRSLSESLQTRVALDLLGGSAARPGFFVGLFQSARYSNFEVLYDPFGSEQIVAGRVVSRDNQVFFDTWTSFPERSYRLNPRPVRQDFAFSDYRISATVNPDLSLDCVTRMKVKSVAGAATAVSFHMAPQMSITSATVNGQPAEVLQHDSLRVNVLSGGNQLFVVLPPEPLAAGRDYEFEFHHSGKVIVDAGSKVYYVAARGNWYPADNQQFARFDLQFRYPADLDLVAAGDIVEDHTEGEWRTTRRRTASPIRFAAFNLGQYQHARVESGPYVVDVCANRSLESALQPKPPDTFPIVNPRQHITTVPEAQPPQNPADRLHQLAGEVAASLQFMVSKFGAPALPHITVTPIPGGFGQGFPGLIYISTLAYLKDLPATGGNAAELDLLYFDQVLQAHELAHQWWGNRVTSGSYRDSWIMEALANTSALLYLEKRKGMHPAELMLETYRSQLLAKAENGQTVESAGPVSFGTRLESSLSPAAYRTITYGKGTWIMQMLRRRMGDDRFLAMLADILKQYDRRQLSNDEFRQMAAKFLPPGSDDPQLQTFFDQWVYGTGIPTLKLSYSVKGKAPDLRLSGTVTQADVEAGFSTLVPVEIQLGRGQNITRWVRTGSDAGTFSVELKQAPLKVALDPHNAVLRRP